MMRTTLIYSIFFLIWTSRAVGVDVSLPLRVPAPVENVFIPHGFDNNDNVELVLYGIYPNSCYQSAPVTFEIDSESKRIEIQVDAYYHLGAYCAFVTVEFTHVVELGLLPAGEYEVHVRASQPLTGRPLTVDSAPVASRDSFLYAPVKALDVETDLEERSSIAVLKGQYPMVQGGCMVLDEIKTQANSGNVFVVLPIMQIVNDTRCQTAGAGVSFEFRVPIDAQLDAPALVHVRSLEGRSLNQVF